MINILKKQYRRLYPRLKALGKLPNIRVYEKTGEAGETTFIANACESIPPDVKRVDYLNVEVWIASTERGIIECLARETPFTLYGTYLALLQNRLDNVIDLAYLRKLAMEENCLPLVLAVMSEFNEVSGRDIFELTEEEKKMASSAKKMVDTKEIKHTINTVMG